MHRYIDLSGKTFGRLTVISFAGKNKKRSATWLCKCECGVTKTMDGDPIRRGVVTSCGCRRGGPTHRKEGSRVYRIYHGMLVRCFKKHHPTYRRHGARGITVCDRWRGKSGFINFLADMGEPAPGQTLDRYPNNNGNYEPGNCRWATWTEQNRNTRANRLLTYQGRTLCVAEWSEVLGVPKSTLWSRIARGLPIEKILVKH